MTGVAAAAAFAANAVMTTLVTHWVYDVDPPAADARADEDEAPAEAADVDGGSTVVRASAAGTSPSPAVQTILNRNVFCPTCVDAPDDHEAGSPTAPQPVASRLSLRLVATMESSDPRFSLATIYDPDTQTTGVFATGDTVIPGVVVTGVGAGVLAVDAGGQSQLLRIGESTTQPVRPTATTVSVRARPSVRVKPASASLPGAAEAIQCPDAATCVVQRDFVESLIDNPAALARQAVVRPSGDGFALARVRPRSLPALLGFETGDELTEVNGEPLDSIDKAFALFTRLRHASNLEVTVRRKGQLVRKRVRIS